MGISHVLRGWEWVVSTPKHLQLYDAFGWKPPQYAHLPLIMNVDGTKLSKRQKDITIASLRNQNYPPAIVLNFVTLVGGAFKNRQEERLYSLKDYVEMFDLSLINSASSHLEMDRIKTISKLWLMQQLDDEKKKEKIIEDLRSRLLKEFPHLKQYEFGETLLSNDFLCKLIDWGKNRVSTIDDFIYHMDFNFVWGIPTAVTKHSNSENLNSDLIRDLSSLLVENWGAKRESMAKILKEFSKQKGVKFSDMAGFLRMCLCGSKAGPPIVEMLEILGLDMSLKRLKIASDLRKDEE